MKNIYKYWAARVVRHTAISTHITPILYDYWLEPASNTNYFKINFIFYFITIPLTFNLVTLQDLPKRLKKLLQVFCCTHATQITHKHLGGVERPSPGLLHHQVTTFKLSAIELPYGAFGRALSLQVDEGKLPKDAAAHHLAIGLENGRQFLLRGVQGQVPHEELHRVALIHHAAERGEKRIRKRSYIIVLETETSRVFGNRATASHFYCSHTKDERLNLPEIRKNWLNKIHKEQQTEKETESVSVSY